MDILKCYISDQSIASIWTWPSFQSRGILDTSDPHQTSGIVIYLCIQQCDILYIHVLYDILDTRILPIELP
jgi:hypothetical protein